MILNQGQYRRMIRWELILIFRTGGSCLSRVFAGFVKIQKGVLGLKIINESQGMIQKGVLGLSKESGKW